MEPENRRAILARVPIQEFLTDVALTPLDHAQLPHPSQFVALQTSLSGFPPRVVHALAVQAARGENVGVILGDNRFEIYALAQWAHAQQLDPRPLLAHIELSRTFTCHQLHRRVLTLDVTQLRCWSVLYVLGLLDTFYDEDVRHHEAARLLRECLDRLRAISTHGLPVLITVSPPREPGREHFVGLVRTCVDLYRELDGAIPELDAPRQLALDLGIESRYGA